MLNNVLYMYVHVGDVCCNVCAVRCRNLSVQERLIDLLFTLLSAHDLDPRVVPPAPSTPSGLTGGGGATPQDAAQQEAVRSSLSLLYLPLLRVATDEQNALALAWSVPRDEFFKVAASQPALAQYSKVCAPLSHIRVGYKILTCPELGPVLYV